MVVETTGEYCSRLPIASRLGSVTSLNCRVLRADGLIKVVQGPASRLRQRQPLGPAFDLLVIDKLFFDGTSQKQCEAPRAARIQPCETYRSSCPESSTARDHGGSSPVACREAQDT